jgi:hypothetical protein
MRMQRRNSMCKTCIFRGIDPQEARDLALIPPEDVPCHTDCPFGGDIQCRGHFEARRKYPTFVLHDGERAT